MNRSRSSTATNAMSLRRACAVLLILAGGVLFGAMPASASDSGIVVSEFRFRGPAGGNDEFVELYNTSAKPLDISGWRLQGCAASSGNPSDRASVPDGTTLGSGDHYLFTNSGGYSGTVPGDTSYSTGISDSGGVRVVDAGGVAVDGVASSDGATDECREGTGLDLPTSNGDNSFERKNGGAQDTNDNASDFAGPKNGDPQDFSGGDGSGGGSRVTSIHDIQGAGDSSPMQGKTVTIEGVVTGMDDEIGASYTRTFPEDAGIFVQEESKDADSDPNTSEGIFVGYVRDRQAYPPGTVVRLTGTVKEKFGLTMLDEQRGEEPKVVGEAAVPAPVVIDPAQARAQGSSRSYYESLEDMRVSLAEGTANSGGANKFGELFLTPGTERNRVFRTENVPSLLATDADAGAGDPSNPYEAPPSSTLVRGDLFDRVENLVGPLAFSYDNYKIMVQPGLLPTVTDGPIGYPYTGVEPAANKQVRVASFNVENFLSPGSDLDLSTVTPEEYALKRNRIVDAIGRLLKRPDVVAVQEVKNKEILDDVARHLGGYTAYLKEGNDERGIDVGFLVKDSVKADNVRQLGNNEPNPTDAKCSDVNGLLFDRPPLAIDIKAKGGIKFTMFSNHFASKGSPDKCREAQAAFVRDQVQNVESHKGQAIVAGDLNAFEDEGALKVLQDGKSTLDNLWNRAPEQERYSYQFSGKLQTLDHVLVTDGLEPLVRDFQYAHFDNDYYQRDGGYGPDGQPDGHKVSDHDPPVLTLSKKPADKRK